MPNVTDFNRDKEKEKVLDQIEIDLPSKEDIIALNEARFEGYDAYQNNIFKSNIHTHMAVLTGKARYSDYAYLKDFKGDDKYNISYTFIDSIVSDDMTVADKLKNFNRYNRQFLIRPILNFNNNPKLFEKLNIPLENDKGEKMKYAKIKLGWAPRYIADKTMQYRLNISYKKHLLAKNNDVYTFDSRNVHNTANLKKRFKPMQYPVYEFKNRLFIRYKVFNCYNYEDTIKLTNNLKYRNGEYVWVEVTQIPWIVDIERKVLIAQEGLLSGIQFENYDKEFKPLNYYDSNIKKYLDTYMKYEILANESILFNKTSELNEPNESNQTDEITNILNKICEYKKYYCGDVNVEEKINTLISNYNAKLDELSHNIGNKSNELSIEVKTPRYLYQRLIIDFNTILSELIINGEKVKSYHDMIDILMECQKDEIDTNKDELCITINKIKSNILEFVANEQIKNNLKEELGGIIDGNINKNKSYIEMFKTNSTIKTKSLEELKIEFKRDLQPYLEILSGVIEKQDLVNEIMTNANIMINNHFTESKNNIIKNYLNILNSIISKIKETGTEEDIKLLKNIIELDFDINEDTNAIIRKLESMIVNVYKIELDIIERQNKNQEINNLKVNIDISSIFNQIK